MSKPRFSPLIPEKQVMALSGLVQLLVTGLKPYQTATIHLGFDGENSPDRMPAVVISKLPGGNWLLEIPFVPLSNWQQVFKFFQFTGWVDDPTVDFGVLAAGPRKLVEEPDHTQLCNAVLGSIEDLIMFGGYSSVPQFLVGDSRGQVVDLLGGKLYSLIKKYPSELNLIPPHAFELESRGDSPSKDAIRERVQRLESEAETKGISFYSTLGYMGVPRFLFLVDSSDDELQVYFWNGSDFVKCASPEIVQAVTCDDEELSTIAPVRTPTALVQKAWPKALALLDFEIDQEGES